MAEYIAANGTVFTDEDIERWAEEAEAGWLGIEFGPLVPGPPVKDGEKPRPFTKLFCYLRYLKVRKIVRKMNDTESQEERNLPSR